MDRPLVILTFQGLLGDFHKSQGCLNLRNGAIEAIKMLTANF